MTASLKLLAGSPEDVPVISSIVQDAIVRMADMSYVKSGRNFNMRLNRFRREGKAGRGARIISGLRIDNVLDVQSRHIARSEPEAFAVLLAVEFEPGETEPEGHLVLSFAGGGDIRLHVEAVDMILADVSAPRRTSKIPSHDLDSTG